MRNAPLDLSGISPQVARCEINKMLREKIVATLQAGYIRLKNYTNN